MIYLHEPFTKSEEKKNLTKCLDVNQISSIGLFIKKFEDKISAYTSSKYAIACSSGTAALHIALKVLGVNEDCEVIVPTITFIATANAVKYNQADLIFMDNDDYFNIDEKKTIEFLNQNTFQKKGFCINKKSGKKIQAIIITHMYGNAAEFENLYKILKKKNIKIIEDSAESFGTKYTYGLFKGKHTGSIGDIGCFSFNGNKIITTGNGGAIITNNKMYANKFKYYINQSKEHEIEYIHNEIGYNYRMTNLSSALGCAQIDRINLILKKKKKIYKNYSESLKKNLFFKLSEVPHYGKNNHWLTICKIINSKQKKNIDKIKKIIEIFFYKGIELRPVWKPCHLQKHYRKSQKYKITNATRLYYNSFCLPSGPGMTINSIKKILRLLNKIKT